MHIPNMPGCAPRFRVSAFSGIVSSACFDQLYTFEQRTVVYFLSEAVMFAQERSQITVFGNFLMIWFACHVFRKHPRWPQKAYSRHQFCYFLHMPAKIMVDLENLKNKAHIQHGICTSSHIPAHPTHVLAHPGTSCWICCVFCIHTPLKSYQTVSTIQKW